MGYPKDLLSSRAVIEPGKYAIIPPEGLVNNVIPGFENCIISIVASPKYGASFVEYVIKVGPSGGAYDFFGGDGRIETFLYCIKGEISVTRSDAQVYKLTDGGYIYCSPSEGIKFNNLGNEECKVLLYKQVYIPVANYEPHSYIGNVNNIKPRIYDNMENVTIIDLLPVNIGFDMNMHILTFETGGSHPFVETHVQEHGAYLLSGEGMYYLSDKWIPVKKEDFIWFGPYVPQAVYCAGREKLSYIYSKDCNRDVIL